MRTAIVSFCLLLLPAAGCVGERTGCRYLGIDRGVMDYYLDAPKRRIAAEAGKRDEQDQPIDYSAVRAQMADTRVGATDAADEHR